MRVIAFSCVHLMTLETAIGVYEYEGELDYEPFHKLCLIIQQDPPDVVVNLGDFTEPFYEKPQRCVVWEATMELLKEKVQFIKVAGNHDREDGVDNVVLDGLRYEHGHKLSSEQAPGADGSVEGYIKALRANTLGERLVHGHTHVPYLGPPDLLPLDVGSVTFSSTYGVIENGVPLLQYL